MLQKTKVYWHTKKIFRIGQNQHCGIYHIKCVRNDSNLQSFYVTDLSTKVLPHFVQGALVAFTNSANLQIFRHSGTNNSCLIIILVTEDVEKDNRPAWLKYVSAAAAALVVTGGIAASTMKLMKNREVVPSVQAGSNATSSSVITNKTTTEITTVSADITTAEAVNETAFVTSETVSAAQAVTAAAIPTVTEIPV